MPVFHEFSDNITLEVEQGASTAIATWIEPISTDNSGYQTMTSSHDSGDTFQIGTTMVNYTSVDPSGNVNTIAFFITVSFIGKNRFLKMHTCMLIGRFKKKANHLFI